MTNTAHTPTPWKVQKGLESNDQFWVRDDGGMIAECRIYEYPNKANAEFIVTACNAHEDLVKALKESANDFHDSEKHTMGIIQCSHPSCVRSLEALAKAGVKS